MWYAFDPSHCRLSSLCYLQARAASAEDRLPSAVSASLRWIGMFVRILGGGARPILMQLILELTPAVACSFLYLYSMIL